MSFDRNELENVEKHSSICVYAYGDLSLCM